MANRSKLRSGHFRRRLMVLLLLVIVGVAAAPMIISRTPLRNTLLGLSMSAEGWRVESQGGSFSWLSEQSLSNLSIVDPEGNPLLAVESITVDRSLLSLVSGPAGSIQVTVVRPILSVATREEGSNVEDLIAGISSDAAGGSDGGVEAAQRDLRVEIVEGAVRGFDVATQRQWLLSEANVSTHLGDAVEVSGGANLSVDANRQPGRVKFRFVQSVDAPLQLELLAERLPLGPVQPWLRRASPGSRVAGEVSADAKLSWHLDAQGGVALQTSGRIEVEGLDVVVGALAGDRLHFDRLVAPWRLSIANEVISIEQLEAKSEWATLSATGSMTFDEIQSFRFDHLPKHKVDVGGHLQLDRLAAMFPRTLQLREGVQINAGELEFTAAARPGAERTGWSAAVVARNVSGTDGRRPIRWEQPIEASVELVDTAQGPQLTQVALNAPFAEGSFETTNEKIAGSFRFNLKQLSEELGQLVDLGDWQFRGQGDGVLSLAREPGGKFDASANLNLSGLNIAENSRLIWAEPHLKVALNAQGTANGFEPQQIDAATIQLRGASESLKVVLLDSVDFAAVGSTYKLRVLGNGPLASWAGRLRPWIAEVPATLEGEAYVKATLHVAPGMVHVLESEGSVAQLRVRTDAFAIDEPRVQFAGDCRWEAANNRLATQELQLMSSSLALRSRDLVVQLSSSEAPTARGRVAFRADLERLASIAGLVGQQDSTWPRGTMTGTMALTSNPQQLQAEISAGVEQLQVVRTDAARGVVYGNPELVWAEPELKLAGRATYLIADDRLQVENVRLDGRTMQLSGKATLDRPSTDQQLWADGMLEYDSAEFAKLMASYLGPEVQVYGDRQIRFQVAGRLSSADVASAPLHWSQRLNVTSDAGWSSASVYGLPVGAGRLQGTLGGGQLQIAPLDLAVGQGRLTASPRALLAPEPGYVLLPKGVLLSSVEISPQVSETMLKYVAPIVAGATRTSGKFSVDLEETRVPLADPKQASVSGRLTVHRLNVSPGPMMADLVRLVKQIKTITERKQVFQAVGSSGGSNILTIENRQIDFQVAEGRVYHRNLEFIVDGVPVRSYGSVGFDQTLALMIGIPIQEKWIEKERALRSLAGQSIQIPVRGTFQKPRIDERAVAKLSQQLLQGVATEAIGGEINRALDKLFK